MNLRILAISLVLTACGFGPNEVDAPSDPAALNVLFIGNSLTTSNDLPGILHALIDSAGAGPAEVATVAFNNFGLPDHWASGEARRSIAEGGWDVVVLQQGPSATEGRPSLLEFSELFDADARSVGAKTALFMVWPSVARFFDFDGVSESYRMAAERVDGWLFPAGEAWRAGWARDSSLALYSSDGFHPSTKGSYLAALVMFEQLTGRSPVGLPARIRTRDGTRIEMSAEIAATLQAAASEANRLFALNAAAAR